MAANNQPQFTAAANVSSCLVTTGNGSSEGGGTVGTDTFLAFTPGANDSELDEITWMPTATSVGTAMTATVARAYLSSVNSGSTTSANMKLIAEVVLPNNSANNATTANTPIPMPIGRRIPSGMYVLVQNAATPAANTQWSATAWGRNY